MKYIELFSELKKNKVSLFSLRDVENLFPKKKIKSLKNNLGRWVKMGFFFKLKRNLYEFVEPGVELYIPDVYIANKLYSPSYVSLETALSIYGLIPDVAMGVTSMTTRSTREFKNKHGAFSYRNCQKKAFTGYRLTQYEGFKVFIADTEKALVDFIFFAVRRNNPLDFDRERFNKGIIIKLNWSKISKYSRLFNKKTATALQKLRIWAKC